MPTAPTANAFEPVARPPRSRLFWAVLGVLAAGQLFAFWTLCSHQVRQAEARRTEQLVQQMALADCLQYIPGATMASCASRMGVAPGAFAASEPPAGMHPDPALSGATPVSFSLR